MKQKMAFQKCNTEMIFQEMASCVGGFKNPAKNKLDEINSKRNRPALNLVMVPGNKMDVQHTHRWQNRDVAFLMDSALLKKKEEGGQ